MFPLRFCVAWVILKIQELQMYIRHTPERITCTCFFMVCRWWKKKCRNMRKVRIWNFDPKILSGLEKCYDFQLFDDTDDRTIIELIFGVVHVVPVGNMINNSYSINTTIVILHGCERHRFQFFSLHILVVLNK